MFSVDSQGMRVGPHPHTSLQTFTWMLAGDITLLIGALNGYEAPTLAFSPLMGADMLADAETTVRLNLHNHFEYGVLVLEGSLRINLDTFAPSTF